MEWPPHANCVNMADNLLSRLQKAQRRAMILILISIKVKKSSDSLDTKHLCLTRYKNLPKAYTIFHLLNHI